MKARIMMLISLFCSLVVYSQELETQLPEIAVLDVVSGSYASGQQRLFTDILRSQIFKTGMFSVIEPGVIQRTMEETNLDMEVIGYDSRFLRLGQVLEVEKLFICSVESFGEEIAVNGRIVDVMSSTIDFTDIIFVRDESQVKDALAEMVLKIDIHYRGQVVELEDAEGVLQAISVEARRRALWERMGADSHSLEYLMGNAIDPDEYLFLRQYDIEFTPRNYVDYLLGGYDLDVLREFLQSGITFSLAAEGIGHGITRLDQYKEFSAQGFDFRDYLSAYKMGISTPQSFRVFREGYQKDLLLLGLGGVADSWPVANADYKFVLGKIAFEHFLNDYQRDFFRFSVETGTFLMNMVGPVPFVSLNSYYHFGGPFYIKLAAGGHYDPIFGGHGGLMLTAGIEIMRTYEIDFFIVPLGSQPNVSYTDFETRVGDSGYQGIVFPYAGIVFKYKMPLDIYRYDRENEF